jgi:hypothetical protein
MLLRERRHSRKADMVMRAALGGLISLAFAGAAVSAGVAQTVNPVELKSPSTFASIGRGIVDCGRPLR